jgi:HPt (histidine-containing phosphotransfer) domain-containing protein
MTADSRDFSEPMRELRASFVQRAAQQRGRLMALTTEPAALKDNLAEIQRLSHSLHGSAGIFGYPEIGVQAELIEVLCIELGRDVRADDPRLRTVAARVNRLCLGIEAMRSGG